MNSCTLADSLLSTTTDRTSIVFDCEYRSTDIWKWNKFCVSLTWCLFENLESVNCWKSAPFVRGTRLKLLSWKQESIGMCVRSLNFHFILFLVSVPSEIEWKQLSNPRFPNQFKYARFDVKQFVYAHTETRNKHFELFRDSQSFFEPRFRFRGPFQSNLADTIVRMQLNLRCSFGALLATTTQLLERTFCVLFSFLLLLNVVHAAVYTTGPESEQSSLSSIFKKPH